MPSISVHRRVRPLRFALLVDHRDRAELRKAIQVNTIQWGGRFNAIVPVFRRTPRNWRTTRTAAEIVRGYLDAFEPDFVVVSAGIDATRLGVDAARTVPLDSMLTPKGLAGPGMNVLPVYRWRYQHEFRFVQRTPPLLRRPRGGSIADLFLAAVFGEYPGKPLERFAKAFDDLGGEDIDVQADTYVDTLKTSLSPLMLGRSGFETRGLGGPRRTFFLLDPESTSDLIDFWNLRALGWHVVGVPVAWSATLAPQVATTLREEHQPTNALPAWTTRACFLAGRSVDSSQLLAFAAAVGGTSADHVLQNWLPRIWEPAMRDADRVNRVEIVSKEEGQVAQIRDDWFDFRAIAPPFLDGDLDLGSAQPRFANVVDLHSSEVSTIANVLPREMPEVAEMLRAVGDPSRIRSSSEGVAVLADDGGHPWAWRVPHGLVVFKEWFKAQGELKLSGAGKIANRLIELLGGPDRARMVNNVKLIRLLGSASESASRDITHDELLSTLKRILSNPKIAEMRIETLVRQGVLKLGMRLQCEQCAQRNWFALDELREVAPCQWCRAELRFPTAMPPKTPCWSYRPLGPFAAKGYAQGAYVVAAAVRTLTGLGASSRATWLPSFTLEGRGGKIEADFAVLLEVREARRGQQHLLLGECKTFNDFEAKDLKRMRQLAKAFPGAVMVLATFKAELSPGEQKLITPFATWGRKNWRSPVMVLTARELTSDSGLPYCWNHGGVEREVELYRALTAAPAPRVSFLRLAEVTQRLHLGMIADPGWPHPDAS